MRRSCCFFLCLTAFSLPAAPPEDISKTLAEIREGSGVPALAAAAVLKEDIVAVGTTGIRKLGDPAVVTPRDKFHLGSNTKSMTATLAAILVRDGVIGWKTTIEESFPDLKVHPGFAPVTLEQLLSNTGGCPRDLPKDEWNSLFDLEGPLPGHRLALARLVLAKKPSYQPGKGYKYSNAGFAIAGAMLEQAAQSSYETLLTNHVFKPLGMDSAGFRAPGGKGPLLQPYGHLSDSRSGKLSAIPPGPQGDNPDAIAPAGLVHCSIIDFAKYARAHLGYGPKGFLSQDELKNLHRPRSTEGGNYALGWAIGTQPWAKGPVLNHTGSNTMWYCTIWVAPGRDFAVVAACNSGALDGFRVCRLAMRSLVKKHLGK